MSEELKKCPFCGADPDISVQEDDTEDTYYVVACTNCNMAHSSSDDEDVAIRNWNDRPIEDAQAARIAELEDTVRKLTGRERILGDETILYAAPEMYDVLQHYFDLLEQANNGDAVAECKLFEDIVLIEQVLMKAKGEA